MSTKPNTAIVAQNVNARLASVTLLALLACAVGWAEVSADWTSVTTPDPMWSMRKAYTSVVLNGRIWVLGGCLPIPALLTASADTRRLDQEEGQHEEPKAYSDFLASLNQDRLSVVQQALSYYKQHLAGRPIPERDAAFLAFREFFYAVRRQQNRIFWKRQATITGMSPEKIEREMTKNGHVARLRENGFRLTSSEGDWYITEDPDFLYERFSEYVSDAVRACLDLWRKELTEGYAEDAGLRISFSDVAERVLHWERYIAEFPKSPLLNDAKWFYRSYFHTLFVGMDNSPVFVPVPSKDAGHWRKYERTIEDGTKVGDPRGVVREDIRMVYERIIADHGDTQSGALIAEYCQLLGESNFQRSPQVDLFLKRTFSSTLSWEGLTPPKR